MIFLRQRFSCSGVNSLLYTHVNCNKKFKSYWRLVVGVDKRHITLTNKHSLVCVSILVSACLEHLHSPVWVNKFNGGQVKHVHLKNGKNSMNS